MSLRTKKILVSVISFVLTLCVAFAVTSFLTNGSKSAFAEEVVAPNKETVEWGATYYNANFVDNKDGTITVTKYHENAVDTSTLESRLYNPYTNIIKKDIIIPSGKIQHFENGQAGTTISARWDPKMKAASTPAPRVGMFDDGILIGTTYTKNKTSNTSFKLPYNDGLTLEAEVPYTVYFSVTNNKDGDTVTTQDIYFKLVRISDGKVFIEVNKTDIPAAWSEDKSAISWVTINGDSTQYYNKFGSSTRKVEEYEEFQPETYYVKPLVKDEDISYYWNGLESVGKESAKSASSYQGDNFCAPNYNNRMTFKLTFGEQATGLRIAFGEKYSDVYFRLSYASSFIQVGCARSAIGQNKTTDYRIADNNNGQDSYNMLSEKVTYALDYSKEYKVSIAIRDVLDSKGNLTFRMPTLDIAEIGNESNCASVSMISDFLPQYKLTEQSVYDRNFNGYVTKIFQTNLIRLTNLGDDGTTGTYTLSAIEPWKEVTIGEEKVKVKLADITLPEGNGVIGYVCSADSKLYAPGKADLRAYTGKEITFVPVAIDSMPTVLNFTDMSFVDVKLRFKLEVANEIVEALEDYAIIDFVVKKGDEVVECEKGFGAGDGTTIMTLTTGVLDASDYDTVFVASATITIEYANCDAQTIQLPGTCSNSASHIASYALENPAEFGKEAWNEGYIAEFERILAGGAQ